MALSIEDLELLYFRNGNRETILEQLLALISGNNHSERIESLLSALIDGKKRTWVKMAWCVELSLEASDKIIDLLTKRELDIEKALSLLWKTKPTRDHLLSLQILLKQKKDTFSMETRVQIVDRLIPFLSSSSDSIFNPIFLDLFYSLEYSCCQTYLSKWSEMKTRKIVQRMI